MRSKHYQPWQGEFSSVTVVKGDVVIVGKAASVVIRRIMITKGMAKGAPTEAIRKIRKDN
ncbi:hypothetical protein GCM10009022_18200 [Vreelandella titanicae]